MQKKFTLYFVEKYFDLYLLVIKRIKFKFYQKFKDKEIGFTTIYRLLKKNYKFKNIIKLFRPKNIEKTKLNGKEFVGCMINFIINEKKFLFR